jgi:hypothetical protein
MTFFAFAEDFESLAIVTEGAISPFFSSRDEIGSDEKWRQFLSGTLKKGDGKHKGADLVFSKTSPLAEKAKSLKDFLGFDSPPNDKDRTIIVIT